MNSSELIRLKSEYISFRNDVSQMITYNTNALDKINGSERIIGDSYRVNDISADGEYIKKTVSIMNTTLSDFKSVLTIIDEKIQALNRQIEIAKDKEMAKAIDRSSTTRTTVRRKTVGVGRR